MTFIRKTKQREAICQVIEAANRPVKPEEIVEAAAKIVPGLGIATVYRNISKLIEEGWLSAVDVPGQPPRYELADKHHHHHFLCRNCEQMFDVDGCVPNLGSITPPGFTLEDHHITLFGVCNKCC